MQMLQKVVSFVMKKLINVIYNNQIKINFRHTLEFALKKLETAYKILTGC